MGMMVSALVVLSAFAVSGGILARLIAAEAGGRERRGAGRRLRPEPTAPPAPPAPATPSPGAWLPAAAAPMPAAAAPMSAAAAPMPAAAAPMPALSADGAWRWTGAVWAPTLSADGAWRWTGATWVPARWDAALPLPAAPYRPARSHGCAWAAGVGCVLLLSIVALAVIAVVVALAGLAAVLSAAVSG